MADLFKKIKNSARRIQHGMLETLHVVDGTDDSKFEDLLRRFTQLEDSVKSFHKDATDYVNAIKAMQTAQSKMSTNIISFYEPDSLHRSAADAYLAAQTQSHDKICQQMIEAIDKNVLKVLEAHVAEFVGLKKLVEKRKRKLTDVDYFNNKLKSFQGKTTAKNYQEELKQKEDDLKVAESIFTKINDDLTNAFESYLKAKSVILNTQLLELAGAQSRFFSQGAEQLSRALEPAIRGFSESDAKDNQQQSIESFTLHFKHLNSSLATGSTAYGLANIQHNHNNNNNHNFNEASYNEPSYYAKPTPPAGPPVAPPAAPPMHNDYQAQPAVNVAIRPFGQPFAAQHQQFAPNNDDDAPPSEGAPPAPIVHDNNNNENNNGNNNAGGDASHRYVTALFDFTASGDDELSFHAGDRLLVEKEDDSGWWFGQLNGKSGIFPSNYVTPA